MKTRRSNKSGPLTTLQVKIRYSNTGCLASDGDFVEIYSKLNKLDMIIITDLCKIVTKKSLAASKEAR